MKKIYKYGILGMIFTMTLSSCEKEFLQTSPTTAVATAEAFKTTKNAMAALNGIHRIMFSQVFGVQAQGGQSGNMLYMDVMGEDVVFMTTSSSWFRSEYQWITHRNPTSSIVQYNYLFYYVIIGNANMIIANIDAADGPQSEKDAIKAEALTYRGWAYYQAVQLFGKRFEKGAANDGLGIPLVTAPSTKAVPRSSVAQVYAQVNKDLDDAIGLFAGYKRSTKSHFNVDVAKGIKARVALTQQDYVNAAKYAREARTGYALMSNDQYLGGFNNYDNSEWMWGSRILAEETAFFYSFFANFSNYNSTVNRTSPKLIFSPLYDQISATDVRKKLWDPSGTDVVNFPKPASTFVRAKYESKKFRVADPIHSGGDVPYMRAAEMYLIEAEAEARAGNNGPAAQALYTLTVKRDPSYTLSTKTGQALVDEIMLQRRVELWGEGFRFYDLKRTNSPLNRNGGNHNASYTNGVMDVAAGDIKWQFLIPQDEIDFTNGIVVQNQQ